MPIRFLREPFGFGAPKAAPGPGLPPAALNGVALTDDPDRHLRDKIMAVLFTSPGERVNNPRFGVGLNRAVFEGLNELTVSAIEYRVAEGLRRDIGDEFILDRVDIRAAPPAGELLLTVGYRRRTDRVSRNLEVRL
jgi:phage baseplate assembly protein W